MRLEPKPFQKAAIAAALRAFEKQDGPRRFLVADEVGLGKTVVARGVVEGLAARRQGPLSVFYVCSNLGSVPN
jgi:superfamily II DNA or RNA helicase